MRTLEVIAGGTALLAAFITFGWLLDRLGACFYGGLNGSQLVPHQRQDAEWARLWLAVNGADKDFLPPSCDPCVVRGLIPYQRGEMP